jgi:hypothetical protein
MTTIEFPAIEFPAFAFDAVAAFYSITHILRDRHAPFLRKGSPSGFAREDGSWQALGRRLWMTGRATGWERRCSLAIIIAP